MLASSRAISAPRSFSTRASARSTPALMPADVHIGPSVEADRIFTTDGPIWTSAGMSAGVDLALALVENDLGAEIAREVAKILVVYHRRAGGQSQYSTLLDLVLRPRSHVNEH